MAISGFSINSNETLLSSGYFSQIGIGSTYATIQNISFAPNYINLPNSINVGVVAGTANRICAYLINVDGYQINNTGIVVLGKNIVGGIFGRTLSSFDIFDVSSSVSTNAYKTCTKYDWTNKDVQTEEILYNESGTNNSLVSYSGTIIGYVGGSGIVQYAKITNVVASIGMVSGFMFGGIGNNATVKNIEYSPIHDDQNFVRASAFGGIFAGEIKGKVENIIIGNEYCDDTDVSEDETSKFYNYIPFRIIPKVPMAVGGLAGIVRGDNNSFTNCVSYENVVFSNSESILIPEIVGGLIGSIIQTSKINQCKYLGKYVDGRMAVGGLVGQVEIVNISSDLSFVDINNCEIGKKDEKVNLTVIKPAADQTVDNVYLGGVVGLLYNSYDRDGNVESEALIEMGGNKAYANLNTKVDIYGGTGTSEESTNCVYVAGAIGSYKYDSLKYIEVKDLLSFVDNEVMLNINLSIRNLRNGDLTSFTVRVYYVIAVIEYPIEKDETKINVTIDIFMVNNQECTIADNCGIILPQ